MPRPYLHVDVETAASAKSGACGDVSSVDRTSSATTIILCDGIGSGIRAHIAATMSLSRLRGLLAAGSSLHKAFAAVAKTMDRWKDPAMPYTAFALARIANTGETTVLCYEFPAPVLASARNATVLPGRTFMVAHIPAREYNCFLVPGEGLLIFSDGVMQAGIGRGLDFGWGSEGVARFARDEAAPQPRDLAARIVHKAFTLSGGPHDDITVMHARCRPGREVTILTGPPADPARDRAVVDDFLAAPGRKVICGGTTAEIVARRMKKPLDIERTPTSLLAPPRYMLEGIDLVTEGAVTLNQLCNIIDVDPARFSDYSGVTELYDLLAAADRVNITMGTNINPATRNISFTQQGILTREHIVPILADKLRARGKLVVINKVGLRDDSFV